MTARFRAKRRAGDALVGVQAGNYRWWDEHPMTYDWRGQSAARPLSREWFDDQDRLSVEAHGHFATERIPFDRLLPYDRLAGKEVLEIGVGSGFHAELLARAGASVTGIDLTGSAIERTKARFELKGLAGSFEQWDAERPRDDFRRRFSLVWSWGVVHHSSRTARIVRNVGDWVTDDGGFAGMVYHRNSTSAFAAVFRDWVLRGNVLSHSVDEALWAGADGYSARFYPADQWRDLLLAFFATAAVSVTGNAADAVPLPRRIRGHVFRRLPPGTRDRVLARFGSMLVFDARRPLRD